MQYVPCQLKSTCVSILRFRKIPLPFISRQPKARSMSLRLKIPLHDWTGHLWYGIIPVEKQKISPSQWAVSLPSEAQCPVGRCRVRIHCFNLKGTCFGDLKYMIEGMDFKAVEAQSWRLKIFLSYTLFLTASKIFVFKIGEPKNS